MKRWLCWLACVLALGSSAPGWADEYDELLGGFRGTQEAQPSQLPLADEAAVADGALNEVPMDAQEAASLEAVLTGKQPAPEAYRIGPSDVLQISVLNAEELSRDEQVNSKGEISLPLLGTVQVAGLTPQEVERLLAALLGEKYFQNPQVNVYVKEFNSQRITIYGQVKRPGVYPINGEVSLMDALATAGGFDAMANEREVLILRADDQRRMRGYTVNVEQVREGVLPDPPLRANDYVVVEKSGAKVAGKGALEVLKAMTMLWIFF